MQICTRPLERSDRGHLPGRRLPGRRRPSASPTHLVEANLVGHDSHGVIRVSHYVQWLRAGKVLADRTIQVVFENEAIAVVDGQFGFGQTIGEQAMQLGIEKSARHGVAVIALRNAGHLGRIGDWPLMAARAGKLSLHFVNTTRGRHPGRAARRHQPAPVRQPDRGRRSRRRRPADPPRHLGLHHRRGQNSRSR